MDTILDFIKKYSGIAGILGMSLVQLLNLQPSSQSLIIFITFSVLAVLAMADWLAILRAHREVRRGANLVREHAYSRRARRAAAVALVLTPPLYAVLTLSYHVPNTWPIVIQVGAERRATSDRLRAVPGRSLLGLPDDAVAPLFMPEDEFTLGQAHVYYIAVTNRSTQASPPLHLRLVLHPLASTTHPPAQPYLVAVAVPAAHAWRPLGLSSERVSLLTRILAGSIPAPGLRHVWLNYRGLCEGPAGEAEWCFTEFPKFPITRSNWRDPELGLPLIPPRGSLEVYLELAFRVMRPDTVPITLVLSQAETGPFPVHLRRDLDLQTGARR